MKTKYVYNHDMKHWDVVDRCPHHKWYDYSVIFHKWPPCTKCSDEQLLYRLEHEYKDKEEAKFRYDVIKVMVGYMMIGQ